MFMKNTIHAIGLFSYFKYIAIQLHSKCLYILRGRIPIATIINVFFYDRQISKMQYGIKNGNKITLTLLSYDDFTNLMIYLNENDIFIK